ANAALRILAADANSWSDLYLEALRQAGILRPEDTPPAARTKPVLDSLMAVLAAGILAGPTGNEIISGADLPAFFSKIHQWYGDKPEIVVANADPHDLVGLARTFPDAALFDQQAEARTHYQAFPVFVRFANKAGIYFPDQPTFQEATPLQLQQFLQAQGVEG